MRTTERSTEDGFTLIELMVVVLIIGILIAIALPMMIGARTRAHDRAAQANIKYAFTAEKVHFSDNQTYSDTVATMQQIETSLPFQNGDTPLVDGVAYLHVHPIPNEIYISVKSVSGTCFYLRETNGGGAEFAKSAGCAVADTQTYTGSW